MAGSPVIEFRLETRRGLADCGEAEGSPASPERVDAAAEEISGRAVRGI